MTETSEQREEGIYHVKLRGKWTVAEMWHGCESGLEVWALPGKLGRIDVDYFDKIGNRIGSPDEAPVVVDLSLAPLQYRDACIGPAPAATEISETNYQLAHALLVSLPEEARSFFERFAAAAVETGNELQLPPEQMLTGLAVVSTAILLCHADVHDEAEIDRLISFVHDATEVTTAMRLKQMGAFDA